VFGCAVGCGERRQEDPVADADAAEPDSAADSLTDRRDERSRVCPIVPIPFDPGSCAEPGDGGTGDAPETVHVDVDVRRGTAFFDAANSAMDGIGRLVILAFDQDPRCEDCDDTPRALVDERADLSDRAIPHRASMALPRGPLWFFAWLDDDEDQPIGGPYLFDRDDLVTIQPVPALACADVTVSLELGHRLGTLSGELSVSSRVAEGDLTGDVYIVLYPTADTAAVWEPSGLIRVFDVDLRSPRRYEVESAVDYDAPDASMSSVLALIPGPATHWVLGFLDADGNTMPTPGDLYAFASPSVSSPVRFCADDSSTLWNHDVVFNFRVE
jgi:hypothetical protein